MGTQGHPIGATETALDVVEFLSEKREAGVTEIATALDCSKSTVFNQLKTLEQRGYVVQDGTQYSLGYRLFTHGLRARRRSAIMAVAQGVVDDLAETTDQLVSLVAGQRHVAYYLYQAGGLANQRAPIQVGEFEPLWACTGGQVILSYLSDERVATLSEQHEASNLRTLSDQEFDSMGDRRIAFGVREHDETWQTIAAPILTLDNTPIGALEVIGPGNDLSGRASEIEVPGLVLNAVKAIEKEIIGEDI